MLQIFFAILVLTLYFIPAIVAYNRNHNNKQSILVLNLFLGWTFIGWVGSLVWAYTDNITKKEEQLEPDLKSDSPVLNLYDSEYKKATVKHMSVTAKFIATAIFLLLALLIFRSCNNHSTADNADNLNEAQISTAEISNTDTPKISAAEDLKARQYLISTVSFLDDIKSPHDFYNWQLGYLFYWLKVDNIDDVMSERYLEFDSKQSYADAFINKDASANIDKYNNKLVLIGIKNVRVTLIESEVNDDMTYGNRILVSFDNNSENINNLVFDNRYESSLNILNRQDDFLSKVRTNMELPNAVLCKAMSYNDFSGGIPSFSECIDLKIVKDIVQSIKNLYKFTEKVKKLNLTNPQIMNKNVDINSIIILNECLNEPINNVMNNKCNDALSIFKNDIYN